MRRGIVNFNIYSRYNKNANFATLVYGDNVELMESELNEMQLIQSDRLRDYNRMIITEGSIRKSDIVTSYNQETNTLSLVNFFIMYDGYFLDISGNYIFSNYEISGFNAGTRAYVMYINSISLENVIWSDTIASKGIYVNNIQALGVVENYLKDSRLYGRESSRRKQIKIKMFVSEIPATGTQSTSNPSGVIMQDILTNINYLTSNGKIPLITTLPTVANGVTTIELNLKIQESTVNVNYALTGEEITNITNTLTEESLVKTLLLMGC